MSTWTGTQPIMIAVKAVVEEAIAVCKQVENSEECVAALEREFAQVLDSK